MFKVVYLVKSSGVVVTQVFDSPYLCRKLVNKLRRSKVCELISCPVLE